IGPEQETVPPGRQAVLHDQLMVRRVDLVHLLVLAGHRLAEAQQPAERVADPLRGHVHRGKTRTQRRPVEVQPLDRTSSTDKWWHLSCSVQATAASTACAVCGA